MATKAREMPQEYEIIDPRVKPDAAGTLGGVVVIESLFALPGLGTSTLTAINRRDYAQLQTNVLFIAAAVVVMNLIVDLTYAALDPRVRLR